MNENRECDCSISKECSIANIIESIALGESSIAHIINAESEKLDAIIAKPDVTVDELLAVNQSVKLTLEVLLQLELVLEKKLDLVIPHTKQLAQ